MRERIVQTANTSAGQPEKAPVLGIHSSLAEIRTSLEGLEKEAIAIEDALITALIPTTPTGTAESVPQEEAKCPLHGDLVCVRDRINAVTRTLEAIRHRCLL